MFNTSLLQNSAGQIVNFANYLDQSSAGFLIKPITAQGIGGFVFSIADTDRIELRSDITDYTIENNATINSHIALKPMTMTLRGFVGELVNEVAQPIQFQIGQIVPKLAAVSAYFPQFSAGALNKYSLAMGNFGLDGIGGISVDKLLFGGATIGKLGGLGGLSLGQLDSYVASTQNLVSSLGVQLPWETKQQRAFSQLKSMFTAREIFTVETPWGYFDRMAITSIVVEQDGKTNMMSDMSVSLKQLSFATIKFRAPTAQEKAMFDLSPPVKKNPTKGGPVFPTTLKGGNTAIALQEIFA